MPSSARIQSPASVVRVARARTRPDGPGRPVGTVRRGARTSGDTRGMRLELTRQGDYAVRAMLALAGRPGRRLAERAADQRRDAIPERILPRVMTDLVRAGLVEGRTGPDRRLPPGTPGRRRSRLLDVIAAVEPEPDARACVLRGEPVRARRPVRRPRRVRRGARRRCSSDSTRSPLDDVAGRRAATSTPIGPTGPGRTGPIRPIARPPATRRTIHIPRTYVFPRHREVRDDARSMLLSDRAPGDGRARAAGCASADGARPGRSRPPAPRRGGRVASPGRRRRLRPRRRGRRRVAGTLEIEAFDLGFTPNATHRGRGRPLRRHAQEHRRDPPRPDLPRRHDDRHRSTAASRRRSRWTSRRPGSPSSARSRATRRPG